MNINKRYAWQPVGFCREKNPLLPHQSLRGLVIGKSGCGKTTEIFNLLLQPVWLDYNHLYVFGMSLHPEVYKVLMKGFQGGLSKQKKCLTRPSMPSKNTAAFVMKRYELTFTMIARIFQIHRHWTLHKRICCCWTTVS